MFIMMTRPAFAILILGIFVMFFWAAYEQAGNVLNVASLTLRNSSINGIAYRDSSPEISSLGAIRISRQTTIVNSNAAQDVFRFVDVAGEVGGETPKKMVALFPGGRRCVRLDAHVAGIEG